MAAQIPIVATTASPGVARNSKKRPASPSHNGSSTGGYGAGKKKKASASSFAQVRCSLASPRAPVGRLGRGGRGVPGRGGAGRDVSAASSVRSGVWCVSWAERVRAHAPVFVAYVFRSLVPGADETLFPLVWTRGSSVKNLSPCTALEKSRRRGRLLLC